MKLRSSSGEMMKKKKKAPSFFKVLIGDFSTKLVVPPDFMKNFNGDLPKISSLKSPTKKSWGVLMEKTEEGFFFTRGWSKFVTDHRLKFGDFLIFRLTTNSTFRVLIYGHNACEKDTSFVRKQSATGSTLLPKSLIEKANHKKKKIEPETSAVDDSIKPTNNLSFVKEMSNQDTKCNIWLPRDFARDTGLESKTTVILKDITECGDGGGEEWPVFIQISDYYDRVRLASGWSKFFTAKGLALGDSCLFEFVHSNIHVKITRKGLKELLEEESSCI